MRKALIVIPTYNEKGNIKSLIEEVFSVTKNLEIWSIEILIVDSHSPDGTAKIIKEIQKKYKEKIHLLETEKEGLGKAYFKGFEYALEKIKPYVIFEMDADWSHLPKYIPEFLKKIEEGADFVIGSRYTKGGSIPKNWGLDRKFFSILGNQVIRWGFMKPKITDWTSGYRAIKSWIIKDNLPSMKNRSGYVFQVAMLDKAIKKGAVIKQVPIHFKNRKEGESKINSLKYSIQTFSYVLTHSSFIKFVIVGFIGFIIDFSISFLLIEKANFPKNKYWLANTISGEIAIVSNFILNNFWSFSHKKIDNNLFTYLTKFLKFNLISAGSVIIQSLGVQIFTNIIGPQYWIAYKIGIIMFVIIPYSYVLYNKFIWKKK